MVVSDFYIMGVLAFPAEDDAPLVVDPDGMKTLQGPAQAFKAVSGWIAQVVERFGFKDGRLMIFQEDGELERDRSPARDISRRFPIEASSGEMEGYPTGEWCGMP